MTPVLLRIADPINSASEYDYMFVALGPTRDATAAGKLFSKFAIVNTMLHAIEFAVGWAWILGTPHRDGRAHVDAWYFSVFGVAPASVAACAMVAIAAIESGCCAAMQEKCGKNCKQAASARRRQVEVAPA